MRNASPSVPRTISSAPLVGFLCFLLIASCSRSALAQASESVGVRAKGMGGAFTAVADDATATWWNPAGLAGGAYANVIVEYGTSQEPKDDVNSAGLAVPAGRTTTNGFAAAFPALGVSYYRLRVSEIRPLTSTAPAGGGRQDPATVAVYEQTLVLNQFGVTIGQSIGEHFVVGSTLKLVQGSHASAVQSADVASLDQAQELDGPSETHGGLDLGAMASFGRNRLGLTVRNVTEIEFTSGSDTFTLKRSYRAGWAYSTGRRGVIGSSALAVDADLTTTPTPTGDERRVALGGEIWLMGQRLGLRGGVGTNTVGSRRTALSGGVSAMLLKHTYVDAAVTGGTDTGRHGWTIDARLTF
ncbi:MAG TPA: conjugal transfer protein TraF [Vicinamibacterales bacterium]